MLFASFPYILIFLPLVVLVCIALQALVGAKTAQAWILAASIFFYAKSRPENLVFLIASILVNWLLARWMSGKKLEARKPILVLGITLNVLYLGAFKYLGFFASIFAFALPHGYIVPVLPFPLGISFFTITQIMYMVDCYEDIVTPGTLFDHASFVSFFPYMISGPLARAKRIRHQFGHFGGQSGRRAETLSRGIFHFSLGLFKKGVFADSFARIAIYGHTSVPYPSALEGWIFSICYALQIYFDFSGYSDMAIGSAMMLGIEIPRNFDSPYSATSITDFWQRWHISLTGFITTYLYTPLFRSLKKRNIFQNALWASSIATVIALTIAGLWHGAAGTFVIYGLLHGTYLAVNQIWRKKKMPAIPAFPAWLLTFACVVIAFAYFEANTIGEGTTRVLALFNPVHAFSLKDILTHQVINFQVFGVPLLVGLFLAFLGPSSEQLARDFSPTLPKAAYAAALTLIAFFYLNSNLATPFVYYRF